jgi:SAM-dependent methyltransferase
VKAWHAGGARHVKAYRGFLMPLAQISKPHPQSSPNADSELFERRIRQYARSSPRLLQILEAGCGRRWSLNLVGVNFHLTGVDLNADAIGARVDLDEAIVGDLRSVPVPVNSYDIVYSSFVLEHVAGAERVLDVMAAALRPGGLLLLRIPDRDSVFGFAARHSPHWLHVQYVRRIRRGKLAGTPGRGPFPCIYDQVVSWRGITAYCALHGLQITDACSSNFYLTALGRLTKPADRALRLIAALTAGRLTADHSNLAFVIRKPLDTDHSGC